jgi:hypothetical protein
MPRPLSAFLKVNVRVITQYELLANKVSAGIPEYCARIVTLMSRGPGRVERAIEAVFDTERDNAFTLEDLGERVYPGVDRIEKKHRAVIARAARNLGRRRPEIHCLEGEGLGGALVFFRHDEVVSYAMARLKAAPWNRYRSKDRREP